MRLEKLELRLNSLVATAKGQIRNGKLHDHPAIQSGVLYSLSGKVKKLADEIADEVGKWPEPEAVKE